jgi:DNA polymerase-4
MHLNRHGLVARTVTVKLRFSDFKTVTRSRTLQSPVGDEATLRAAAGSLAFEVERPSRPIRLLGVTVAQLTQADGLVTQERIKFPPRPN